MFVNGGQKLACKTQIADLEQPIRVEPLPHAEVEKDLVVDLEHFYDQMEAVEPYFQTKRVPRRGTGRTAPDAGEPREDQDVDPVYLV